MSMEKWNEGMQEVEGLMKRRDELNRIIKARLASLSATLIEAKTKLLQIAPPEEE